MFDALVALSDASRSRDSQEGRRALVDGQSTALRPAALCHGALAPADPSAAAVPRAPAAPQAARLIEMAKRPRKPPKIHRKSMKNHEKRPSFGRYGASTALWSRWRRLSDASEAQDAVSEVQHHKRGPLHRGLDALPAAARHLPVSAKARSTRKSH